MKELLARLSAAWIPLPDKPDETPETTLRALWQFTQPDEARLAELVDRRISGVPLAHLTGRQTFLGIEMLAGPEALIPRKETEIVCRGALRILQGLPGHPRVIDVCTGAGNIALALAYNHAASEVFGADISEAAVDLARRNAAFLGLSDRVHFAVGDLFAPVDMPEHIGNTDLVTCNPPYISSAKVEKMAHEISGFEPRLAFDGGPFGVKVLTRLIREAPRYLRPGGWLAFEVGLGQGKSIAKMIESSAAYCAIETLADQNGETRALLARVAPASV